MNRRRILAAAPAIALGFVAASPAAALTAPADTPVSPLRALYDQWQGIKDAYSALPSDCDEETDDRLFMRMREMEQQAADFEPQTMEDLIFKIIFADDNGDMDMNIHQEALAARAYAMAEIEPRNMKGIAA